ncbi:type II toxin-antitoxin system RelE/ParE family toxin [Jiella sp. CBK1P-4]|uniref:Type II toxin-antitoxin system RelE/ParE family toxin n=2 Tax=Jiella avicenniae TaxID=2907202 RepID=A0A9X1T3V7_9HYPH|nr:type II toxin-antitoxin system RelE/ParE family toxin [Jiella avicenniae]
MGLDDAAMREIEAGLAAAPNAHPVIRGLRGVRKARFALPGRGKSGGGRVIYYVAVKSAIYMMTAYPKNESDDLSNAQREAILAAIERLKGGAG